MATWQVVASPRREAPGVYIESGEKIASLGLRIRKGCSYHGLNFNVQEKELSSNKLENLRFVVSGVFSLFSRTELKKIIEDNGGKNVSSISKSTDYLIVGENMGPAKKEKAEKVGFLHVFKYHQYRPIPV